MNLMTGEAADELFGGEVPPTVHALLAQAREATRDEVPSLLWAAHACAPQCLAIYYLLYKCHAGRRQFELAERAARTGLAEAARQAGLAQDWRSVQPGPDFDGTGPARFWLFTLKALAFISLRSGRPNDARELLAQISLLAPQAHMGGEVIASMLEASIGG
jgi:hypothetical protein